MVLTHLILNDMMKVLLPACTRGAVLWRAVAGYLCVGWGGGGRACTACLFRSPSPSHARHSADHRHRCTIAAAAAPPPPQVKGHIAKMALCLEDGEPRIAALAQLFFHELAKKEYKVRWEW